jgi:hypothetical protein
MTEKRPLPRGESFHPKLQTALGMSCRLARYENEGRSTIDKKSNMQTQ